MIDINETLNNLSLNFNEMSKGNFYIKQQISDFYKTNRIKIDFNYCHVALSMNGGLIAICKKKNFLDTSHNSRLNNYVIVMFQNAKNIYNIKIDWNYNKRWIVCLDFTKKQELYGILNDGGIFKFKYIERIKKEKVTPKVLKDEGIVNAKLFKRGFIARTGDNNFYYIVDINNPNPLFLYRFGLINLSKDIDFVIISPENSNSKKIELLIPNEEGNGVLNMIQMKDEKDNIKFNIIDEEYTEAEGLNLILKGRIEPYKMKLNNEKKKEGQKIEGDYPEGFGKIDALAISPSGNKVALYNSKNKVAFIMNSDFEGGYSIIIFNHCEEDFSKKENDEINAVLEFKKGNQFLFCGEDTVAVTGQRFVILSRKNAKKAIPYLIKEGSEFLALQGVLFSKCVSEVDGLRCLTNEGVFFINKMSKSLYDICYPFSDSKTKNLIKIYQKTFSKKYNSHNEVKALPNLSESICELQNVAADLFWTEEQNEEHYKEIQLFLLKVAQYGKYFVDKDLFNYDKFNSKCKDIRILNHIRNDEEYPIFITYKEYLELNSEDIIEILIRYKNFKSASQISKYLDYGTKRIMYKYMVEKIKKKIKIADQYRYSKDKSKENENEEERIYQELLNEIEEISEISYVKLAKKSIQFGNEKLAIKLLDQEKSALTKIPQLIELNKLINSLDICFETYDFNIISTVLIKISERKPHSKTIDEEKLFDILCMPELQKHHPKIILYLKKYKPKMLEKFLLKTKNYNDYLFIKLEEYFKAQTFDERKEIIGEIRKDIKNYDSKYKKYIEYLEYSLKFKKACIDDNYIHYSEIEPYSNTVGDCMLKACKKEKYNWVEGQNKNLDYSNKKLHLMRFRALLEMNNTAVIDAILEKTTLKKLGLTPLNMGEIYYDYKLYDKATEYLIQVKEQENLSYVVELLRSMSKYKEALEIIISDKDNEAKGTLVNEILHKDPSLKYYVDELCVKYKVYLG